MASLDILCFNSFNLKNKIMKIEHSKIFLGPSKVLENISWLINICLKYFKTAHKNPPAPSPTYFMYGPLMHSLIPSIWIPNYFASSINTSKAATSFHLNYHHLLKSLSVALLVESSQDLNNLYGRLLLIINSQNLLSHIKFSCH